MKKYIALLSLVWASQMLVFAQHQNLKTMSRLQKELAFSNAMLQAKCQFMSIDNSFAVNPNAPELAVYNKGTNNIDIILLKTGSVRTSIPLKAPCFSNLVYSANNNYFAYTSETNLHILDPITYQEKLVIKGTSDKAVDIAISPDGKKIAVRYVNTKMTEAKIYVYTSHDDKRLNKFKEAYQPSKMCFSPDGKYLKTTKLYDLTKDEPTNKLDYSGANCFTVDGDGLIYFDSNGDLRIKNVLSLLDEKTIRTFHHRAVNSISYSKGNKYLLTCANDSSVHLIDVVHDSVICQFKTTCPNIFQAGFCMDDDNIVAGTTDNEIRIWMTDPDKIVYHQARIEGQKSNYGYYLKRYSNGKFQYDCRLAIDTIDYESAKSENTIESYKLYNTQHPGGDFQSQARSRIEDLYYENAVKTNRLYAFQEYRNLYPLGRYSAQVDEKIELLVFADAEKTNTIDAYTQYLQKYKKGKFIVTAYKNIESLSFSNAVRDSSLLGITRYLEAYPDGRYAENAKQLIAPFKAKSEKIVGQQALTGNLEDCEYYNEMYPKGQYSAEVKLRIAFLQEREKALLEKTRADSLEMIRKKISNSGTSTGAQDPSSKQ